MIQTNFFRMLSAALRKQEVRHAELSALTFINLSTLGDLMEKDDEWYAVVPLYQLRFLCGILGVPFDEVFEVPAFKYDFKETWERELATNFDRLKEGLYMSDTFWEFLKIDIAGLNLYPFQWSDDIASRMQFSLPVLLALLKSHG